MSSHTDNLRAAQSPTHSANIRKWEIITKFVATNGHILFFLAPFQTVFGPWREASRGVSHIVITLGGRKNSEKMQIF